MEQQLAGLLQQVAQTQDSLTQAMERQRALSEQQARLVETQRTQYEQQRATDQQTLGQLHDSLEAQRAHMTRELEVLTHGMQQLARPHHQGVVDVKAVGKPSDLGGKEGSTEVIGREWPVWTYTFTAWFCSQFQHGEECLEWARDEAGRSRPT